jgi:hypothetical protein
MEQETSTATTAADTGAAAGTPPPPPPPPPLALPVDLQHNDALGTTNMTANVDIAVELYDEEAEDFDSSDEEFNQRNFGIYQALPVDGEPDWSLGECFLVAAAAAMPKFITLVV